MEPFKKLSGVAAPLNMINVDTDMIIPKQFLKTIRRTGLGKALFDEMRYRDDGSENPDFVLNKPAYRKAQILVGGANFGCGSSREHAPWALLDFGIRAVISTSLADIFCNNALKNGLLPMVVDAATHRWLLANPGAALDIDIEAMRLSLPNGAQSNFPLEPFARHCLLQGLDGLSFLRSKLPDIERYETCRP